MPIQNLIIYTNVKPQLRIMNVANKATKGPQDYINFSQHYTSRQTAKENSQALNKENKFQSLLAAIELNRTAVVDQRKQMHKDHY